MKLPLLLYVAAIILLKAAAFPEYQDLVPNGNRVPHPCLDNYMWLGLGHKDSEGGGERNPFGEDFDLNGKVWDKCLCERDSDGDGKTNGEELGDPECVWTVGAVPARLDGLTHPGVCEPLDDIICQERNDWEFCTLEPFICDALEDPEVEEIQLRYPLTEVPPTETNYFCMTFDLPINANESYHMIASEPLLNNTLVTHHMIVYGCVPPSDDDDSWKSPVPVQCGMDTQYCTNFVALWAVGNPGICYPEAYGFRLGEGGYTTVMIQVHWNNPELRPDYKDAPGMSLHVTKNLRANDAGIIQLGTIDIFMPGGVDGYTTDGSCRTDCTENLQSDFTMDQVILHMHYLGVESAFYHARDGILQNMIVEKHYSYDNPKLYRFDSPVTFKPGDTMSISCVFDSTGKTKGTKYGDGTSDEMCYAFVTYYPKMPDVNYCMSFKSLNFCPLQTSSPFPNCENMYEFLYDIPHQLNIYMTLNDTCNKTGASPETCPEGCQEVIDEVYANNTCLQGDTGYYAETVLYPQERLGYNIVSLLHICDPNWDWELMAPVYVPDNTKNETVPDPGDPGDGTCVFDEDPIGAGRQLTASAFLLALCYFVQF